MEQQEENKLTWKQQGKRQRGQNKSRPHVKPTAYEDQRLCQSVAQVGEPEGNVSYTPTKDLGSIPNA